MRYYLGQLIPYELSDALIISALFMSLGNFKSRKRMPSSNFFSTPIHVVGTQRAGRSNLPVIQAIALVCRWRNRHRSYVSKNTGAQKLCLTRPSHSFRLLAFLPTALSLHTSSCGTFAFLLLLFRFFLGLELLHSALIDTLCVPLTDLQNQDTNQH